MSSTLGATGAIYALRRSLWRPLPAGLDLKEVLSAKFTRTVARDATIRFEGQMYQLLPTSRCPSLARSVIEVQQWFDGSLHFRHERYGVIAAKRLRRKVAVD